MTQTGLSVLNELFLNDDVRRGRESFFFDERIYTTTYYIPSSPTEVRAYTPILPRVLFKGNMTQLEGVMTQG